MGKKYQAVTKTRKSCLSRNSLFTQTSGNIGIIKKKLSISEWLVVSNKDINKISSERLQIQENAVMFAILKIFRKK